jgi:hypothetical protein
MKNLLRYFSENRKKIEILEQIKNSEAYLKAITPRTTYVGKISDLTNNEVVLKPYTNWENLPQEKGSFLNRVKIEEEIGLPLTIKEITPEKTSKEYMFQFAAMMNYFSVKNSLNKNLAFNLMAGYPFPNKDNINFLEGKNNENHSRIKSFYSENKIGFRRNTEK